MSSTRHLGIVVMLFACLAGAFPSAGRCSTTRGEALDPELQVVIRDLYRRAQESGARTAQPSPVIRLDGIAWEASGVGWIGTSEVGSTIEERLRIVLAEQATIVTPSESIRSKGIPGDIIRGAVKMVGGALSLTLELADAATGRKIADITSTLNRRVLNQLGPLGLAPPDSAGASDLARLIGDAVAGTGSEFGLRVTTDRGQYGAYKVGEPLTLYIEASVDCQVRVYHMSWSDRKLVQIFPTDHETDALVRAGEVRKIPGGKDEFLFEIAPPDGVDAILAVATADAGQSSGATLESKEARLDRETVAGVVAKGVIVKRTDRTSSDDETQSATISQAEESSKDDDTGPATTADTNLPGGMAPLLPVTQQPRMARAVCYFTTMGR